MPAPTQESLYPRESPHGRRVAEFCDDLRSMDLVQVIRKHITTGMPVALERDKYFVLRQRVAEKFGIHPNQAVVVGSARMGFSLKAKKRFADRAPSDIDLAIVSDVLFQEYWDMVFGKVRRDRYWARQTPEAKRFVKCLFSGWITPDELPSNPTFDRSRVWSNFFDSLSQERVCGGIAVKARLYRDWNRLEAYHEIHVADCKRYVEGENL